MTEKTFHTVSWAPSAIKDAVEHAAEAFKAADGAYARVSTFELSALIDATRALIEHNEREETNLKPEAHQVSMEELRARIGAVVDDYTASEDYGSGPTRYYLTVNTPNDLTAHLAAVLFPGLDWLFRAVADWQSLWDEKEEWEKAAKEAWQRENVLSWLHAEAVWHAEHHRAQVERQGRSPKLEQLAAELERLKDVDAEAFAARFQLQSYDIVLGRIAHVLTRLLADANISPLPKQLPHLAYRVEEEFQAVVRQRDEALAALEKQQAMLSGIVLIPEDARSEIRDVISNPALRKLSRKMVGGQRETFASWGARAVLDLLASWGVRRATSELPPTLTNESSISQLQVTRESEAAALVRKFHEAFGLPIHDRTRTLNKLRADLIREEAREAADAIETKSREAWAKELADLVIVTYGAALTMGIDLDEAVRSVHTSNMSKLGDDGKPVMREDGKVLKGPNYVPPDMSPALLQDAAQAARSEATREVRTWKQGDGEPPQDLLLEDLYGDRLQYLPRGGWAWVRVNGQDIDTGAGFGLLWHQIGWHNVGGGILTEVLPAPSPSLRKEGGDSGD